ncbi:MAG: signal peptidase I [Thermodesulfatator sp.]|nr:MAG: signal peptidase I [Thermodesulfatator sp.]
MIAEGESPMAQQELWEKIWDWLKSILIALLLALFVRTFFVQAYKIPSGSMIPTLLIGDHILVNKLVYGLRVPYSGKRVLYHGRSPRRGEVVVFVYPRNRHMDFIKRVIGLPGDVVSILFSQSQIFSHSSCWAMGLSPSAIIKE